MSAPSPQPWVIVAGTGFDGRAEVIRRHCRVNASVRLVREPQNRHDANAIGVLLECRTLLGLRREWKHIGFVKADRAKFWAPKMDAGKMIVTSALVRSFYAPEDLEHPRVSLAVNVEYP